MIKDFILKIEQIETEIFLIYFNLYKPIKYYAFKNPLNYYEFSELDGAGRFIRRGSTDFILTLEEIEKLKNGGTSCR